jgi:hypothetical protein
MDKRTTPEQRVIDYAIDRTKAWHDAAERAEIRNEPALAMYYRNQAWRIETGKEWLADITVTAPLAPAANRS